MPFPYCTWKTEDRRQMPYTERDSTGLGKLMSTPNYISYITSRAQIPSTTMPLISRVQGGSALRVHGLSQIIW